MSNDDTQLGRELAKLEREDPEVRRAAEKYEKMKEKILKEAQMNGQPQYAQGQRVVLRGQEQTGRVQQVSYTDTFKYLVKWDVGTESTHTEGDLSPGELPPHYP